MYKIVFVVAVCVCAAVGTACSRSGNLEAKSDSAKPLVVPVAKAAPEDLSREVAISAEFRPYQEVDVHAKVAGYLQHIYVDVGDHVRAGQVLATLEIPEMQDELTRDAAALKRSDAEVQRERDELARAIAAHEAAHNSYTRLADVQKRRPNLIAQQEIDDALARDRVAEAGVSAARSALASAEQGTQVSQADEQKTKTLFAYARITAPFAGVVSKRYADTGAMIPAGTASSSQAMPVVRISQNDRLRLVLPVPESIVPRIRIGSSVEVRVPTLGRSFVGKVSRFVDKISTATRTMDTEVDVTNPSFILVPGMYAEAVITTDRRDGALSIPLTAVVTQDQKSSAYIVNADGRIEDRPLKLGIETPLKVEVLSGLQPGDLVVTGGRGLIRPGMKVQPKLIAMAPMKEEK
jgi:RND family efflux transporter MFP subunit